MQNFKTWLQTPNIIRVVVVQINVSVPESQGGMLCISNYGVTINSQPYLPILDKLSINESISIDYAPTINSGEIEINNSKGEYDSWLTGTVWTNRYVNIYVGSLPGPNDNSYSIWNNFQQVFSGFIADIDSKNRKTISIKIRDNLQKLNTTLNTELLGNYYHGSIVSTNVYNNTYANSLRPIVYGEVNNITPLLVDPTTLEYMVHADQVESILEVRDNGVPVQFILTSMNTFPYNPGAPNPALFRLLKSPAGAVTCSVQGHKKSVGFDYTIGGQGAGPSSEYKNTASSVIATILNDKFNSYTYGDFDNVSFGDLGAQPVGVYITSRVNMLNLCQDIAKSCGLVLTTNRYGRIKLVDISPTGTEDLPYDAYQVLPVIEEADTILNSLVMSDRLDVIAGVRVGYAKNWTLQQGLLTNIPEEHKRLFATEYLESVAKDSSVATQYNITTEPEVDPGYLITQLDAEELADKKLKLYKKQKRIFSMTCSSKYMYLEVGDVVRLSSSRFGISTSSSGGGVQGITTYGRIISAKPDWIRGTIDFEVLA